MSDQMKRICACIRALTGPRRPITSGLEEGPVAHACDGRSGCVRIKITCRLTPTCAAAWMTPKILCCTVPVGGTNWLRAVPVGEAIAFLTAPIFKPGGPIAFGICWAGPRTAYCPPTSCASRS